MQSKPILLSLCKTGKILHRILRSWFRASQFPTRVNLNSFQKQVMQAKVLSCNWNVNFQAANWRVSACWKVLLWLGLILQHQIAQHGLMVSSWHSSQVAKQMFRYKTCTTGMKTVGQLKFKVLLETANLHFRFLELGRSTAVWEIGVWNCTWIVSSGTLSQGTQCMEWLQALSSARQNTWSSLSLPFLPSMQTYTMSQDPAP
jgi:hypothetical protein